MKSITKNKTAKCSDQKDSLDVSGICLCDMKNGQRVKLIKINGGNRLKTRLAAMNIKLGTVMTILKSTNRGAFIVALKNDRLILGHGVLNKLEVSILN